MPYFSRNPIVATASTANPYERMEIEVFIETLSAFDTYSSLGVFSFISNSATDVEERIDTILHAALMADIAGTVPGSEMGPQLVMQMSRKYYFSYRYYTDGAWIAWTDSPIKFVVLGGEPFEQYTNSFWISSVAEPTFLHPESNLLAINQAQGWVYVLAQEAGTATITYRYWNIDQTVSNTMVDTFNVSRAFSVFRIPVFNPASNKSPFFGIEVTVDGVTRSISLTVDQRYHHSPNEFTYLNSKGGWNFLPCHAAMTKSIEVSQQVAEVSLPTNYYGQYDVSQYKVWDSQGRKKMRVATGYWPKDYMDIVIQDFLLSRYRFWWNAEVSKWLPIIVDTKSATYSEDAGGDLRSLQFEFRPSFDNNIPSAL